VRLLLDEMISPRIALALREDGGDVQAVKRDRPDLASRRDSEIVQLMAVERRAIVTNNIADFQNIHDRFTAAGKEHYGLIFTFDPTMPRTKAAVPQWIEVLADLLAAHQGEDALRNRVHHLP
jgi:predicted nuclease of predicted toxin-antitoxin system